MKVNQRIALTKRLIHEALLRLLETKSIDKINVTELCNESGINRATFYRHYNVPRDVLVEIENTLTEEIAAKFDMLPISDTAHGYRYIENICSYFYDHSAIIKVLISNSSVDDLTNVINKMFHRILAIKKQSSKPLDIEDDAIKLISTYIVGGGYFLLRQWLMEDIQKTPEEIAKLLMQFVNYTSEFYATQSSTRN